ncbi:CDP-alcohol phosphatidyltransferase family protein [Fusobacterium sp.]|uniref:CDP-alcohol phosphatidyltransferase family protein n=1 Tax=Fusobacterium sp. TaxID=68766 RepID=UPI002901B14B|nr:CDP-alcohol phosphatidyltransferase family protein [Fusobacterium sp.]MDU1910893.1 CDP-alcohol phosphatidyltransferase family protein [Fusobacterium sp.]
MDISIYNLKKKFQDLLMPLCRKLNSFGITPNQITIGTMILSIIFSVIFYIFSKYRWLFLTVPLFFLIRMAFNALDGMIASRFDKKTNLGIFLNEIGDVVADTVFFLCFFSAVNINIISTMLFTFLGILSEYTGIVAIQIDRKRHYEGPMGKSDRAFFVSILSIFIFIGIDNKYINYLIYLGIFLLVVTIYNRIKATLKNIV